MRELTNLIINRKSLNKAPITFVHSYGPEEEEWVTLTYNPPPLKTRESLEELYSSYKYFDIPCRSFITCGRRYFLCKTFRLHGPVVNCVINYNWAKILPSPLFRTEFYGKLLEKLTNM